jgi:hypothetical protein
MKNENKCTSTIFVCFNSVQKYNFNFFYPPLFSVSSKLLLTLIASNISNFPSLFRKCIPSILCDELVTRPDESYRLWCVVMCDLENFKNEEAMTRVGSQRHRKKKVLEEIFY